MEGPFLWYLPCRGKPPEPSLQRFALLNCLGVPPSAPVSQQLHVLGLCCLAVCRV